MPQFDSTTTTAPAMYSDLLAGADHHTIVDRAMAESLDLPAGQVLGQLLQTGRFEALDGMVYTKPLSGDGAQTTFDLDHDSVDADSVEVLEGGSAVYDFTISRASGVDGVDQIVFGTAPASGTDNVATRYQRTTAKPAGILMEAVVTGTGENPTMPVLVSGGVVYDQLTGVPDGVAKGAMMGSIRLE